MKTKFIINNFNLLNTQEQEEIINFVMLRTENFKIEEK